MQIVMQVICREQSRAEGRSARAENLWSVLPLRRTVRPEAGTEPGTEPGVEGGQAGPGGSKRASDSAGNATVYI